jgi:hypothetical protein
VKIRGESITQPAGDALVTQECIRLVGQGWVNHTKTSLVASFSIQRIYISAGPRARRYNNVLFERRHVPISLAVKFPNRLPNETYRSWNVISVQIGLSNTRNQKRQAAEISRSSS